MSSIELLKQNDDMMEKPELYNLRLLYFINMFLIVTDFLMPQYFGIHIGWDITCTRFANILLTLYGLLHLKVFNLFSKTFLETVLSIPLVMYLIIALYTMVFRVDINAFMLTFLEVLTFYMLIFSVRYVMGVKRALKVIIFSAYFLGVYGLVEFAAGQSLYLKFLRTVPTAVRNCYRSGYYRIMGPCGHPLGYGLLLLLFIAVACIDLENDDVYLFQRPVLFFLLIINVFLTGSRSSQGIAAIEVIIIIILSNKINRKKTWLYICFIVLAVGLFLIVGYKTRIGKYLMMQITTLIDQAFDTELAANFGVDTTTLKNSEEYRKYLPKIFELDWLNPLIGRGVKRSFSAAIPTETGGMVYLSSIDNYYVVLYIRYAYPGMIVFISYILLMVGFLTYGGIKYRSGILKLCAVGIGVYFFNLWWLDALQTTKFQYAIGAIGIAYYFLLKNLEKQKLQNDAELIREDNTLCKITKA